MRKFLILLVALLIFPRTGCFANSEETPVPILLYHNVTQAYNIKDDMLSVTPERFEQQIYALLSKGYNIISFQKYINYVQGNGDLPSNPVIITFDDGYSGVYNCAYPVLLKHRVPATVFVITGLVGFNDTLYPHFTWEQAMEMDKSGYIDIQSHTNFHYDALEISQSRLVLELRKSRYDIESRLNKKCTILAFPYGKYDEEDLQAAKAAGYETVARTEDKGTNRKSDGLFHLNRIFVRGSWTGEDLVRIVSENNNL